LVSKDIDEPRIKLVEEGNSLRKEVRVNGPTKLELALPKPVDESNAR
jgi:hypothetical protein